VLNASVGFAQNIVPIKQAIAQRDATAATYAEMAAKDPTMIFEKSAYDIPLSEYIKQPSQAIRTISGTQVEAAVAAYAKEMAGKQFQDPTNGGTMFGGQYLALKARTGFTQQEIMDAINGSPNTNPILKQLIESSIGATGVRDWTNNAQAIARLTEHINRGLLNGLGSTDTKLMQNGEYINAY